MGSGVKNMAQTISKGDLMKLLGGNNTEIVIDGKRYLLHDE